MFFSKCFPTNTSMPAREDERTRHSMELTRFPAAAQFSGNIEDLENTVPYSYIKAGNVEKILDALRDKQYHPEHAWKLVLKYPNSPALYLCVIASLKMEEETRVQLIDILKTRKVREELPPLMAECFDILRKRSSQEAYDYTLIVSDCMPQRANIFRAAILNEDEDTNPEWQTLFNQIARLRLTVPNPTPPSKLCCFPKRRNS